MNTEVAVAPSLIARNPIKAAAKLAKRYSEQEVEHVAEEITQATETLAALNKLKADVLPIESTLRAALNTQRGEVLQKIARLGQLDKISKYAMFSLEPLTWRNAKGFPRLAVFSIDYPRFELSIVGRRYWQGGYRFHRSITPHLPKQMRDAYRDVLTTLFTMARQTKKTVRLRAEFGVAIPRVVREEINRVRPEFQRIFVVTEAPKWDLKLSAIPRPADPLVVGYDGKNYWLVTTFDTTPIEQYIEANFCISDVKAN